MVGLLVYPGHTGIDTTQKKKKMEGGRGEKGVLSLQLSCVALTGAVSIQPGVSRRGRTALLSATKVGHNAISTGCTRHRDNRPGAGTRGTLAGKEGGTILLLRWDKTRYPQSVHATGTIDPGPVLG